MLIRFLSRLLVPAGALAAALMAFAPPRIDAARAAAGSLQGPKGICPLKHTDAKARISGPLARVTVNQEFENPFQETIEAVYTFPLPDGAAVDDMTMRVGGRTIRGLIKPRQEARRIYDEAARSGRTASLLDQERPNIFTQSVANIPPGAAVSIEISYVETVPYEAGVFSFTFPTVVGPRYIPGAATGKQGGGWSPDTDRVPDASRITPNVTPQGTRAGHDLSLTVDLETGMPLVNAASPTHAVNVKRPSFSSALVTLRDGAVLPDRDFILQYSVAGSEVRDSILTHRSAAGGFFTLMLAPPASGERAARPSPKELVFVLDTSGSMSGFPINKAKEAMSAALNQLNRGDTFNLITFSGDTRLLFPAPAPATAENLAAAQRFLQGSYGAGGTEMMKAIRAALAPSGEPGRTRVVCFMTDGYVGNEYEILNEVKQHPEARVFSFGIGSSVNRFLLDNLARYGRGEADYVGLQDDGSAAARRFAERVRNPVLTNISIDWGGLPVQAVLPAAIPDLFSARPVVISGQYSGPASGVIRITGDTATGRYVRTIHVNLPGNEPANSVLAALWARRKVDELTTLDVGAFQNGAVRENVRNEITDLGVRYRLMTPFTSFVAVEERVVNEGGKMRRVDVPVEMPDGVSYEGVFGASKEEIGLAMKGVTVQANAVALPQSVADAVFVRLDANLPVQSRRAQRAEAPQPPTGGPRSAPALHAAVTALLTRVANNQRPSVDEARFVFSGQALLRIRALPGATGLAAALRAAGFTIDAEQDGVILGRIAVEKLAQLVKLPGIAAVDPRW